jgi:hypothetical protein
MTEGRRRDQWSRASCLLAMLANIHRDPKKGREYSPADFDPTHEKPPRRVATLSEWREIKTALEGTCG